METVLSIRDYNQKLTVEQLAEALYEGTSHLQNLAEKLARQHGQAQALTFFNMMGEDVKNFWISIAQQLIDNAKEWQPNSGSACILSDKEYERLRKSPVHKANDILREELKIDESFYQTWQANIAMAFVDEYEVNYIDTNIHTIANNAAKNFLNSFIK